jgi:SPP1 family predicted phage head-tail adaptor
MRGGTMDRRITLQPPTVTTNAAGEPVTDWTQNNIQVWAFRRDGRGQELITAEGKVAEQLTTFRIRWRSDMDGSGATKYRVLDDDGTAYDVRAITRLGRKEALELNCRVLNK